MLPLSGYAGEPEATVTTTWTKALKVLEEPTFE